MNLTVRRTFLGRHLPLEARLAPTNDPLFPDQWHLENTSQLGGVFGEDLRVQPVWDPEGLNLTGFGVVVGVVADGLQTTHPDLAANYVGLHSRDFVHLDSDPNPNLTTDDANGTALAGLVAATADNGIGGAGVAYAASLAGLRVYDGANEAIPAEIAKAFTYHPDDIDIYTSGWGPADDGTLHSNTAILAALQTGFTTGRGGLGSIYTWGAGDGQQQGDNVNYDGFVNSTYVIPVAAIDDAGVQAEYSEPGAAILVSAFSDSASGAALTTTDLVGADGPDPTDYTSAFGGTSAAAAEVAGVVALMLEANPRLTARDVQDILVRTARQNDPGHFDWLMNGDGLNINHMYGFGAVDAIGAVSLAKDYARRGPEVVVTSDVLTVDLPIPDNEFGTLQSEIEVPEDFIVDWVQVKFRATHADRGQLDVRLYSPVGTESVLAEQHPTDAGGNYDWTFSTVRNWGESSAGTWALQVSDLVGGTEGTFQDWQVILHGTSRDPFLSAIGSDALTYSENQPDLTVGADAAVSDADSDFIDGATVEISGGFAEDVLLFEDQSGISGDYADGVLTLSGVAPMPDYAAALASVQYRNTSENPDQTPRTLTFQVSDAEGNASNVLTRTLNVAAVNDAPAFVVGPNVSVLQDSDPQTVNPWATGIVPGPPDEAGQTVFFEVVSVSPSALFSAGPAVSPTGVLTFTPAAGQVGTATVQIKLRDNGGTANGGEDESAVQSFTISMTPRPIARPDSYTTGEDTPLADAAPGVMGNDGPSNPPITAALEGGPAHGTLTLNPDGSFLYTPAADYNGTDTFTYTVTDGSLTSVPTTVTIRVLAANDAPVATNDVAATPAGKPVFLNLLANDTDVDGDPLQVATFTAPLHGRVTRSGTGLRYTPSAGYQGADSFGYTVIDGHGGSDTAVVNLTVTDTTRPTLGGVRVGYGNTSQDFRALTRAVLPWSDVRRFEFSFSEAVTVGPAALTLVGPTGVVPLTFTQTGARTVAWTVTGPPLGIGRYSLRLSAALVADANGNRLARDYVRTFGVLPGDFDGSGRVTAADISAIKKNFKTNPTNRFADVNGDGVVNQADVDLAAANLNRGL